MYFLFLPASFTFFQIRISIFLSPDTALQLRRDVIFCQAATAAVCTLAEQLLAALRCRFNNAGEYQEDSKETSRKWLEQISAIGVLVHLQSTLAPHVVRTSVADQRTFSIPMPPSVGLSIHPFSITNWHPSNKSQQIMEFKL